jgi:hypothetical protein
VNDQFKIRGRHGRRVVGVSGDEDFCSRYAAIILSTVDWHVLLVGWVKYGTGSVLLSPGM